MPERVPVLACETWTTNADLIADVFRMGYIKRTDWVLDPTHGNGVWWKNNPHRRLVILEDNDDFRDLPYEDASFDVVTYDPPYVSVGGRATSGLQEFLNRFGLDTAPRTPEALQNLCNEGAIECHRVLKRGGYLLWKTKEYTSSGNLFPGLMKTFEFAAYGLGMYYQDHFIMHRKKPMAQPPRPRQMHARRNCSHLLVFKKR